MVVGEVRGSCGWGLWCSKPAWFFQMLKQEGRYCEKGEWLLKFSYNFLISGPLFDQQLEIFSGQRVDSDSAEKVLCGP